MKNIKKSCLILLSGSTLFVCVASSAAVKSRTVELEVVENGERVGEKVVLTCRANDEKREIFKRNGKLKWCDTAFPDMCAKLKDDLSDRVCSSFYRNKLASLQQQINKDDQVGKLKAELIEIEQKRIEIADKVLELKRRELELQKTLS